MFQLKQQALESAVSQPDLDYASKLEAGSGFTSESGVEFTLLDDVNFKVSSSLDTMDMKLDPASSGNLPTNFRLTKKGIESFR